MNQQVVKVSSNKIFCQGEDPSMGHPGVYLEIDESKQIICPYCGLKYEFRL